MCLNEVNCQNIIEERKIVNVAPSEATIVSLAPESPVVVLELELADDEDDDVVAAIDPQLLFEQPTS